MKSGERRKIADVVSAILVVLMLILALWLVRCGSAPQPGYYAPDTTQVSVKADTVVLPAKEKKPQKTPRRPRQRHHLDEPAG